MSIAPFAPQIPATGMVVFSPADFVTAYPMFSTVSVTSLQRNFNLATLQLNNGPSSRVTDANVRESLLNLLVAHITALSDGVNGQPPAGIVGRVSEAKEGTVSVSAQTSTEVTGSEAYYMQTQWGFQYWQSTAQFRTMVYVPAPCARAGFGGGNAGNLLPFGRGAYFGNR